jgi:hypothetical protein
MNRRSTTLYDASGTAGFRPSQRFTMGYRGFAPLRLPRVSVAVEPAVCNRRGNLIITE